MILEGCYPYVRGGVSSWVHDYMLAMPQHEFVLWVIGAESEMRGKFKYELPPNVVEIHEVFLSDALQTHLSGKARVRFTPEEIEAHRRLLLCERPDWGVLFRTYNIRQTDVLHILMSEPFLDIIVEMCRERYPYVSFAELFHTLRSMLLPMLYLMRQKIPEADVYHSTATGYGGLLGAMAGRLKNRPFIVTEHGIYTREREEEILRSGWVKPYFKQHWISLFYMLAHCAYDNALRVTSLFPRSGNIQAELGCERSKLRVILNGIHSKRFADIPPKPPDGRIDIGAIVRFHPIKDIKTMIYAFFELKARVPEARLHILGDTDDKEYKKECVGLIEQLGAEDILIVGNTDVPAYLQKLDFTLLTSISEGQPLSVLESLCAGRPCVTTDVGCCRDILEGDFLDDFGRAGICVPPMHARALADAMELLCTRGDLREEMGRAGKKRVLRSFLHEEMIRNYLENYEEVAALWQALALN